MDSFHEARETYRRQGVGGGSVGFGRKAAVLVVDFQHAYTRGQRGCGTEAVETTAGLLAAARERGVPVYYTYVAYPEGGDEFGVWLEKCPALARNIRGSEEVMIDPIIEPEPGDVVIEKHFPSAFFGTGLAEQMRAIGVDTVITTGTSTSGCIRATVVDGVSHGFRMLVPQECVVDRSAPSAAAALFDINAKYGDVITLNDVMAHISTLTARVDA